MAQLGRVAGKAHSSNWLIEGQAASGDDEVSSDVVSPFSNVTVSPGMMGHPGVEKHAYDA